MEVGGQKDSSEKNAGPGAAEEKGWKGRYIGERCYSAWPFLLVD